MPLKVTLWVSSDGHGGDSGCTHVLQATQPDSLSEMKGLPVFRQEKVGTTLRLHVVLRGRDGPSPRIRVGLSGQFCERSFRFVWWSADVVRPQLASDQKGLAA